MDEHSRRCWLDDFPDGRVLTGRPSAAGVVVGVELFRRDYDNWSNGECHKRYRYDWPALRNLDTGRVLALFLLPRPIRSTTRSVGVVLYGHGREVLLPRRGPWEWAPHGDPETPLQLLPDTESAGIRTSDRGRSASLIPAACVDHWKSLGENPPAELLDSKQRKAGREKTTLRGRPLSPRRQAELDRLADGCARLQATTGSGPFFLDCRGACVLAGAERRGSSTGEWLLARLERDGVIVSAERGVPFGFGKASTWRHVG